MSSNDELLKLDNQICFRLYAASRQVTRLYRPLLDEFGITYPQYLVLLALWQWDSEADPAPVTVSRISARLLLDAGTLTPLLKRMEEAGLISRLRAGQGSGSGKRKASKADGRELHIQLTRNGRALKQRAAGVPQALLCLPGMPLDDLPGLHARLGRLLAAIEGQGSA